MGLESEWVSFYHKAHCHMAYTKMLLPVCFKKQYGYTALMRAAANGHLEMTQLLLRHGARICHENQVMWRDAVA